MEYIIRLEKIEINHIKNVGHGIISFIHDDFSYHNVLCICGQNGSGKSVIIEVTKLIQDILSGKQVPHNYFISNDKAELAYTFYIQNNIKQLITYRFNIELINNIYQITNEKINNQDIQLSLIHQYIQTKLIIADKDINSNISIEQIDPIIHAMIPSLHIRLINQEIVTIRDNQYIPLKYESEGIKRLITMISYLIIAYNDAAVCLMIDDLDLYINEYLLGELVEIMDESAKGQILFTTNNFRPLEKLSYQSIIFTTTNSMNKYIRLTNVKPCTNIRDYYYGLIMLGGEEEMLYDETKNYKIKRAFRKANNGKFTFTNISNSNIHLQFKDNLEVTYYYENNRYYCDIPELEVYAIGDNKQALYNEVIESIIVSWNAIVECDIDELNPKARQFRKLLKERIKKI
ncbi:MAG: ATP-binding protein [Erysipelotrichaceae bacterium]|nr:ATP-binding protein [Erysipelotrichaceae bacterium]